MRHFFAACWKARAGREGHTWEKGDPRAPKAGTFTQGCGGRGVATWSPEFQGSREAEGAGRGPRGSARGCEGRLPAARRPPRARSWERGAQTGCPACPGRVPTVTARGRSRRRGRLARRVSPPSGRGNVGARTGGPAGWVALAGPRRPAARPECPSRCSVLHHVGGCGERPKRVHGAGCGGPEARGCVLGAPRGGGRGPRPRPVSWLESGLWNVLSTHAICGHSGNPPAPASGPPGHLPLTSFAV